MWRVSETDNKESGGCHTTSNIFLLSICWVIRWFEVRLIRKPNQDQSLKNQFDNHSNKNSSKQKTSSQSSSNKSTMSIHAYSNRRIRPTPLVKDFCKKVCNEFSSGDIERFLFNFLTKPIDDTLKTTIVEILNSMNVGSFKLKQIEQIFKLMQDAMDFTKGKNELVYGNLLLILTKFLCTSNYAKNFIETFGSKWVYELFEMLQKNSHRNVINDKNEQLEKDILNCCFLHFICNFEPLLQIIELDQAKLLDYGTKILHNEIASNPLVSPPLEIEKSFLGNNPKNLLNFLQDSKADTLQYFRILNYLSSHLDGTQSSKNCFKENLIVNQKDLYMSSFDKMRDIIMDELLFFSEKNQKNQSSSLYNSTQQSKINIRSNQ